MLDHRKTGRRFEDLGRFCHWARVEVRAGNDHLAGHLRHDRAFPRPRWERQSGRATAARVRAPLRGLACGVTLRFGWRRRRLGGNRYSRKLCRTRRCRTARQFPERLRQESRRMGLQQRALPAVARVASASDGGVCAEARTLSAAKTHNATAH